MIDVGLIFARLLHYAATTTLFGAALFPLYAYADAEPKAAQHWRMRLLFWAAIAALAGGLLWFVFSVANMSGSLSDLADIDVTRAVLTDTSFGIVWIARSALAIILFCVIAARLYPPSRRSDLVITVLSASLLGSLAGVGHANVEEGWRDALHVASDAAHLLAAGAWLGGLLPLAYLIRPRAKSGAGTGTIDEVLLRFSGMGYLAVATLVATGLVNSWFLVGSVSNLLRTIYGQVLLFKLMLFAGMLALAIANRFWLVPRLANNLSVPNFEHSWFPHRKLLLHVLAEQVLGLTIIAVVSLLGTMTPSTAL